MVIEARFVVEATSTVAGSPWGVIDFSLRGS
jgi:hypothetical protein